MHWVWILIIVIILIIIDKDLAIILALSAVVSNIMGIFLSRDKINITQSPAHSGANSPPSSAQIYDPHEIYGPKYEQWRAYHQSYDDYQQPRPVAKSSGGEIDRSVDMAGVMMGQRRARDKKCMDGAASKDVHFYKYHFGAELDEAAAKPWWSAYEY